MHVHEVAPNVAHGVWPWAALLLLGAVHGINPGMGWLFAVALGMQRQERGAVWRALLPLAGGHAAAIAVAAIIVGLVGMALSLDTMKWIVAAFLLAVGVSKLVRTKHPRWGGMAVGSWQLGVWSFLMASAHGAGLMAVPFLLRIARPGSTSAQGMAMHHTALGMSDLPQVPVAGLGVAVIHTVGYLLVTGLIAVIVYERLGLRLLGRAWFNVDRLWAGTLIATASLTPFLG
jgi:hypothetical protein